MSTDTDEKTVDKKLAVAALMDMETCVNDLITVLAQNDIFSKVEVLDNEGGIPRVHFSLMDELGGG